MFQIILTALTAFVIVWLLGPLLIPVLQRLKPARPEREAEPEQPAPQKKKQPQPPPKPPVPTMGGVMALAAVTVATLIFGLDGMEFALPALVCVLALGVLGFIDDFMRAKSGEPTGLPDYQKLLAELVIAIIVAVWAYRSPLIGSSLHLPFSGKEWDIGVWYVPLVIFVVFTQINAAQFTDGMDGLLTSVTMVYALFMIAILAAMARIANQNGELLLGENLTGTAVFSAAVAGASVGFLCFNAYPARVQAGSSGSLAFGGAVAMLAILSRSILILPVMGFCFAASLGSVILQALSRRREDGKRLFRAVPIHRHFELMGHPAPKIVSMYAIVTAALCAACLLFYLR
ncbi:MAG: phospho-N-acetylmuramoyl-pentapeptide-transferase [Clostridiales bacterium]|nr:phospho-N-acetylmuramoyl-pentapeptide-transferase [Clostridiales bacterium]